ncbi:BON domain-containing protein [Rhizobium rhizophilum]|uniref:BON domain-containing protein n=1 Tax=Rhizobium rhizophilum TaxID=1850373 RepID=A0ABY2QQM1_9HYPH|nr:BON domain-containing protein [Rhizobium rhizophilum]THV11688.1 BON domain-containing protein [Rhizobium rhizophilum]
MVDRNNNWDHENFHGERQRRGPTGDYRPGDSGFVRDHRENRPDMDRYDAARQHDYGMDDGNRGSGSRDPRMGRSQQASGEHRHIGELRDRGYGDQLPDRRRDHGHDYSPFDIVRHDRGFVDRANDEVASWFGDEVAARRREMDGHRGKGPRGYRRSDARILEDVNDRLADDPAIDASDIEVTVEDAEVTLGGHVTDRWEKRRAEDCVDRVSGVTHVQNNLRIRISGEGSVMTQA